MKYFSVAVLLVIGIACSMPSQAQFLKKLKKTVNQAVSSIGTDDNGPSGNSSSGNGNNLKPLNASRPAEEKVKVTALSAFSPKAVYTLLPGEKLDFSESCLDMSLQDMTPRLGIKKDDDYFLLINGQKTKMPNHILVCKGSSNEDRYVYVNKVLNNDPIMEDPSFSRYFTGNITSYYIKFKGNKYGPYFQIVDFKLNKDHSKFLALAVTMNMDKADSIETNDHTGMQDMNSIYQAYTLILLGSDIKPVSVAHTMKGEIIAGDDLKMIRVLYSDHSDQNNPHNTVYNPQTHTSVIPPHKYCTIYRPTGDFVWLQNDAVNNIFNTFYMNGKLIKAFPHDSYSYRMEEKDIFISPADHSKWAANNGSEMFFSDGRVAGSVISPHLLYKDGSYQLYWLTLSTDNKTVVLCHANI